MHFAAAGPAAANAVSRLSSLWVINLVDCPLPWTFPTWGAVPLATVTDMREVAAGLSQLQG
jgi:hypothetical protein